MNYFHIQKRWKQLRKLETVGMSPTKQQISRIVFGCNKGCKSHNSLIYTLVCGERGIRTPGASQHGGFQDRCNRPLYHLSIGDYHFALLEQVVVPLKRVQR